MNARRAFRSIALVLLLGAAGWWAYTGFLAPPADVALRLQATGSAEEKMRNGEMAGALADIERGLQALPGDWELLVWQSVLLEKLNRSGEGSMRQAVETGPQADVWIVRGMVALTADEAQMALDAGRQVIQQSPDAPQGYFLTAQSYEKLGQLDEALRYYQQAADKAEGDDDQQAIYVAARERIVALTS